MSETESERRTLRAALAPQLASGETPLVVLAEDLIGEEDGAIDWVAASPDGVAWVVLVEPRLGDAGLLERGLVQRIWVERRLRDWCKLAPGLPLRPDASARALLIARDFARMTRLAAGEAAHAQIVLAQWSGDLDRACLDRFAGPSARPRATEPAPARLASVFRSGLRDADLAS